MQKTRLVPAVLAPALYIPGVIYESMVRARNALYSASWLPQRRLPRPVVSVGNITMGGTGKTPLVIYLARRLLRLGFEPAILSRGYRRAGSNEIRVVAPGDTFSIPARTLGDEAALIRRHIPSAWIGLCKNRYEAGIRISKQRPQSVLLLDDGFQHRRLYRDLDMVVLDGSQPLRLNRVFPRGTLREPLQELRRCRIVLINGLPDGENNNAILEETIRTQSNASLFYCTQRIDSLIPFPAWQNKQLDSRSMEIHSAFLVAAIGNPRRFEQDIRQLGTEIRGSMFFQDHYWLKASDWRVCVDEASSKKAEAIVITEKDAVKIFNPPDFPVIVAMQSTEISDANGLDRILKDRIAASLQSGL